MSETDAILAASTVRANAKTDQISGIPPRPLGVFRIGDVIDNGHRVKFRFTTLDTKQNGFTLCYVGRVKILKKTGANNPSANPNDGTVVLDAIRHRDYGFEQYKDVQYDDTDVIEGQTYTYTAYVYSDHNICNIQEPSIQSIEVKANPDPFSDFMVWGFYQDFNDLNSDRNIYYDWEDDIYGVVNKNYDRAMTNIFSRSDYNLSDTTIGSWAYFLDSVLNNHMYRINPVTGRAESQVSNDFQGYTQCEDGLDLTTNRCCLCPWINTIYMREINTTSTQGYTLSRSVYFVDKKNYDKLDAADKQNWYPVGFVNPSNETLSGLWLPGSYGHIDAFNEEIVYNTYSYSSGGKSVSFSRLPSEVDTIINSISTRIKWFGGPIINVLRDLAYMIFKSTNIQKACCYGSCNNFNKATLIDSGNVTYDSSAFKMGFGDAIPSDYDNFQQYNTIGFMFHSMVLGTYQCTIRDPYSIPDNDKLKISPNYNVSNLITTIDTRCSESKSGSFISWYPKYMQYFHKIGSIPYVGTEYNAGSTTTGLSDGIGYRVISSNTPQGQGSYIITRLGCNNAISSTSSGLATMYFSALTSSKGWNSWGLDGGSSFIILPDATYSPVS